MQDTCLFRATIKAFFVPERELFNLDVAQSVFRNIYSELKGPTNEPLPSALRITTIDIKKLWISWRLCMSSAKQNSSIAKLIVGAMSIDGVLDEVERKKVANTLDAIGMGELIADVGVAIEEDDGNFNMFDECETLVSSLGEAANEVTPLIFRIIADVLAHDRFVSQREATYLSSVAKRLNIADDQAQSIFRQVMNDRRGRLEVSGKSIDEILNPQLKSILSFEGADGLVGKLDDQSMEELMAEATSALSAGAAISPEDVGRALAVLGLPSTATVDQAEEVWLETIRALDLPKMSGLGETFVSAAITRISRINEAYKTVLKFHEQALAARVSANTGLDQDQAA